MPKIYALFFLWIISFSAIADEARFTRAPKAVLDYFMRTEQADRRLETSGDFELTIYRLPAGTDVSGKVCSKARRCQKKIKGPYTFSALSTSVEGMQDDLLRMNISALQQYSVTGYYEFGKDKYSTLSFKKNGAMGDGFLIEEISFIVRPYAIVAGKIEADIFGLFKYHVLGAGQSIEPSGRLVTFKAKVDRTTEFILIAESDRSKNEPVYVAVIKHCHEIHTPSFDVQMLEKGL